CAQDAARQSSVEAAIADLEASLSNATHALDKFHHIKAERTFSMPLKATDQGTRKILTQHFEFHRGEGSTFRSETSALAMTLTDAPIEPIISLDPFIYYRDIDGAGFLRVFRRSVMVNGDLGEFLVWRPAPAPVPLPSYYSGAPFDSSFIYGRSGLRWTDALSPLLSECSTVTSTTKDDILTYVFTGRNSSNGSMYQYTMTMKRFEAVHLPYRFEETGRDNLRRSQDWSYAEVDRVWVPSKSIETNLNTMTGIESKETTAFSFSAQPEITSQQLRADLPLSKEMEERFERQLTLYARQLAKEKGITLTGRIVTDSTKIRKAPDGKPVETKYQ
ncbi:hypothetical protein IT570_13810, partial [Candidatus Sumerlaeota bacterium]|nr:hypothetical protein [Candidatus Sumerlaeota bacterium]